MSNTFQCGDSTALVTYLYGESDASEHAAAAAHVEVCAACAAELAALESTRVQLASWAPPEPGFDSRRVAPPVLRPQAWLSQPFPAWLQVAAAVVIFAAGLGLGVVRGTRPATGPATVPAAARAANTEIAPLPQARPATASVADLSALESRLRDEIARTRTAASTGESPASPSEARLIERVRALIEESEQRQQRELAVRTAQIFRDVDSQRRVDLEQIHRSVGQIEGLTGAEVREQRQMLNYLMRVSQQP